MQNDYYDDLSKTAGVENLKPIRGQFVELPSGYLSNHRRWNIHQSRSICLNTLFRYVVIFLLKESVLWVGDLLKLLEIMEIRFLNVEIPSNTISIVSVIIVWPKSKFTCSIGLGLFTAVSRDSPWFRNVTFIQTLYLEYYYFRTIGE